MAVGSGKIVQNPQTASLIIDLFPVLKTVIQSQFVTSYADLKSGILLSIRKKEKNQRLLSCNFGGFSSQTVFLGVLCVSATKSSSRLEAATKITNFSWFGVSRRDMKCCGGFKFEPRLKAMVIITDMHSRGSSGSY